jgi:predicted RNA-binding Zn ribbon-like protein
VAKTKHAAKTAAPYMERLVSDEDVQENLRTAALALREAYERIARKRGKAAEDKKLYAKLREAATSLRRATTGLQPPPPKPKRRGRKLLIVTVAGGSAVVLLKTARGDRSGPASASNGSAPV